VEQWRKEWKSGILVGCGAVNTFKISCGWSAEITRAMWHARWLAVRRMRWGVGPNIPSEKDKAVDAYITAPNPTEADSGKQRRRWLKMPCCPFKAVGAIAFRFER